MSPEAEARLHTHAEAIVARAGLPTDRRSDVRDELLGHLMERVAAETADGVDEAAAVARAIEDFGSPDAIGREMGIAHHSRLWASTIGVLLPAIAEPPGRPPVVRWLRLVLGLHVAFAAIALVILLATGTPVRVIVGGTALVAALAVAALAYRALGRGQRWALLYGVGATILLLIGGLVQALRSQPGSWTIPLGSIFAALVLLGVHRAWPRLREFVRGSTMPGPVLGLGLGIAMLGPMLPMDLVPDPTQATAADLDLRMSLHCWSDELVLNGDIRLDEAPQADLTVDMRWQQADLLPMGIGGLFDPHSHGDTAGWRVVEQAPAAAWHWLDGPRITDLSSGRRVGSWGSTAPSVGLLPWDVAGSQTFVIGGAEIQGGHTIRASWHLYAERAAEPLRIQVFYAHLDRFLLAGTVGCGETVIGRQVSVRESEPPSSIFGPPPF